ncbi:MAG TPA: tRNA 2-thiouridine(34) synthase MnmA [Verrucomicrobiae bacterium]|jgi:tRNA-specific 2-thiouridylase|nr:tRNA 2-thiouridine(34) synthase MnmA [Verrucomicrobiae bacterium]
MSDARKTRVIIGMSGGVDSSAAAALLLEQGYDVVGITLKLWPQDCVSRAEDKCCGPQAVTDARSVCHKLGIPYYLIDEADAFQKQVIAYFAEEYKAGRTPNPCVMCNEKLKFGALLERARQLGGDYIATGHFARVEKSADGQRTLLRKGRDARKDQSYFLFSLRQNQLARAMFPLGEKSKQDTRQVARDCQLKTADKEESMEICFVPDNDYGKFLSAAKLMQPHRGDIVNTNGDVLGHHDGIELFTVGQRKGLGISSPKPLYVIELDAARNRVVVGDDSALDRDEFQVERCNWIPFDAPEEMRVTAKIRYNHPGTPATIRPGANGGASVKLDFPQRAITPGQACVFYNDDLVVGGGWITAHK